MYVRYGVTFKNGCVNLKLNMVLIQVDQWMAVVCSKPTVFGIKNIIR